MLDGLTEQQIAALEAELLALVPADDAVGNITLVKRLTDAGWSPGQYWAIRNRLIDRAVLATGRGKGGSVRRLHQRGPEAVVATVPGPAPAAEDLRERALYEPMKQVIDTSWAQDNRLEQHIVEITAHQGARLTGGRWTRPDITLASMRTFACVPWDELEEAIRHEPDAERLSDCLAQQVSVGFRERLVTWFR